MTELETRKKEIEYQWNAYLESGGKSLPSAELTLLRQQAKKYGVDLVKIAGTRYERVLKGTIMEFKDLTGDPVYDYLGTQTLKGHKQLDGYIEEKKNVGPKDARIIIHTRVLDEKTKKIRKYSFNYKRYLRLIGKGEV